MNISKEIIDKWNNACWLAKFGQFQNLKLFNLQYSEESRFISSMCRKRIKLCKILESYMFVSQYLYWGTLTYNKEKDLLSDKVKRNQALIFFKKYFKLYTFVEELGSLKERYHIHFIGVINNDVPTFNEMYSNWHSRIKIEILTGEKCKRKVKYLTKYVSKSVPRVRMCKRSVKLLKDFNNYQSLKRSFPSLSYSFLDKVSDLLDLPF